jgi:hypothetical protein
VEELYPNLTDRQRLSLLRHWVDNATAEQIEEEMIGNPALSYEGFWASLDLSFGAENKESLRRKMKGTKISTRGRLTEQQWREYFSTTTSLARQLRDVSEQELCRLLIDGLPTHPWRRKLAEEEEKKIQHGVLVVEGLPEDVRPFEVEDMLEEETGLKPTLVEKKKNGVFRIRPVNEDHRKKVKMVYDGQRLAGGAMVTIRPDAHELTPQEVDQHMLRWLRLEQRIANVTTPAADSHDRQRNARFYRSVEEEGMEEEEDEQAVREVRKDTRRTPSRESRPKQPEPKDAGEAKAVASPPSAPAVTQSSSSQPSTEPQQVVHHAQQQGGGKSWNSWGGRGKGTWAAPSTSSTNQGQDGKGKGKGKGKNGGGKGEYQKGGKGSKGDRQGGRAPQWWE